MKRLYLIIMSLFTLLSLNAFGEKAFVDSSYINILKESFKQDKNSTVISGLSITFATNMLANGLQGKSLQEIGSFFNTSVETQNKKLQEKIKYIPSTLEISNSIWGNNFLSSYTTLLNNLFKVPAFPLPENTSIINRWIAQQTHNKIQSILKEKVPNKDDLYLINTIYFKDKWKKTFKKNNTRLDLFNSLSKEPKKVYMMNLKENLLYAENEKLQSVKIPYKNGGYMVVYLPKKDIVFDKFIQHLNQEDLNLNYTIQKVHLSFPRFKIDKTTDISSLFKNLGIREIFNPLNKDFSNISRNKHAFVKSIKQRAVVDIDEEGTTASAVTSITLATTSVNLIPYIRVHLNKPFVFYITLGDFIGFYTNP